MQYSFGWSDSLSILLLLLPRPEKEPIKNRASSWFDQLPSSMWELDECFSWYINRGNHQTKYSWAKPIEPLSEPFFPSSAVFHYRFSMSISDLLSNSYIIVLQRFWQFPGIGHCNSSFSLEGALVTYLILNYRWVDTKIFSIANLLANQIRITKDSYRYGRNTSHRSLKIWNKYRNRKIKSCIDFQN